MKIVRESIFSGQRRAREIPASPSAIIAWQHGKPIQEVMPWLSAPDREFILTGITEDEWDDSLGQLGVEEEEELV